MKKIIEDLIINFSKTFFNEIYLKRIIFTPPHPLTKIKQIKSQYIYQLLCHQIFKKNKKVISYELNIVMMNDGATVLLIITLSRYDKKYRNFQ